MFDNLKKAIIAFKNELKKNKILKKNNFEIEFFESKVDVDHIKKITSEHSNLTNSSAERLKNLSQKMKDCSAKKDNQILEQNNKNNKKKKPI